MTIIGQGAQKIIENYIKDNNLNKKIKLIKFQKIHLNLLGVLIFLYLVQSMKDYQMYYLKL